jgi:thioredoxin 1
MSTATRSLTETTFDEEVQASTLPVVVEFWAEWCPPCKTLSPILDSLAVDFADRLRVFTINSDDHPALSARFEVMSIPTILVFSEGQLRQRLVGARSRARLIEELSQVIDWPLPAR